MRLAHHAATPLPLVCGRAQLLVRGSSGTGRARGDWLTRWLRIGPEKLWASGQSRLWGGVGRLSGKRVAWEAWETRERRGGLRPALEIPAAAPLEKVKGPRGSAPSECWPLQLGVMRLPGRSASWGPQVLFLSMISASSSVSYYKRSAAEGLFRV